MSVFSVEKIPSRNPTSQSEMYIIDGFTGDTRSQAAYYMVPQS